MNFDPGRDAFRVQDAAPPEDPRARLVAEAAELLFGVGWRFSLSAEFAVSVEEIDDWTAGRLKVPDFVVAGLMRLSRIGQGGYAAVAAALAHEVASAPAGDYSEPGGLLRNARILIRERDPAAPAWLDGLPPADVDSAYADADEPTAPEAPAEGDEPAVRPRLYLVDGGLRLDAADRI